MRLVADDPCTTRELLYGPSLPGHNTTRCASEQFVAGSHPIWVFIFMQGMCRTDNADHLGASRDQPVTPSDHFSSQHPEQIINARPSRRRHECTETQVIDFRHTLLISSCPWRLSSCRAACRSLMCEWTAWTQPQVAKATTM